MNDDPRFRAIPKLDTFKLPFKLEERALSDWLIDLSHQDGKEACTQIMALLQTLNKMEISAKNRLAFLKLINSYLKQYIHALPSQCWDKTFPFEAEEIVYAQMVTWNYLLLAQGFFIATENAGKKNDIAFSLAMTLYALGQAQLHIAAAYFSPNSGFWNLMYQSFYLAEKKSLQHVPVESDDFKSMTINTLFARNLIFSLCDTNQFQPRDTRTVFNFLPQVCIDLPIRLYPDAQPETFMVDLKYDQPPLNTKQQTELGSELVRYFSPIPVANKLGHIINHGNVWSGTLKSINNTLFSRVVNSLKYHKKRKYKRETEEATLLGVIGFESIIGFLYKLSPTMNKLLQRSQQKLAVSKNSEQDDFIVSEEKNSKQSFFSTANQIWEASRTVLETPATNVSLKKIKVYDASTYGYSVSWTAPPATGKIGDLIGVISEDKKRLEIVIVRRIVLGSEDVIRRIALNIGNQLGSDFDNNVRMGTEVIGFESEIVYLSSINHRNVGTWAIFIPGIQVLKKPDTVIYAIGKFSAGEPVYLYRGDEVVRALVFKELYSTVVVSYVELAYPTT